MELQSIEQVKIPLSDDPCVGMAYVHRITGEILVVGARCYRDPAQVICHHTKNTPVAVLPLIWDTAEFLEHFERAEIYSKSGELF